MVVGGMALADGFSPPTINHQPTNSEATTCSLYYAVASSRLLGEPKQSSTQFYEFFIHNSSSFLIIVRYF
jgi:hypothetical protein